MKTAMDIHLHFQQMGFVMAPFGIAFRTHGAEFNSSTDEDFFRADDLTVSYTKGVVNNVIELMQLDIESQRGGNWCPSRSEEMGRDTPSMLPKNNAITIFRE